MRSKKNEVLLVKKLFIILKNTWDLIVAPLCAQSKNRLLVIVIFPSAKMAFCLWRKMELLTTIFWLLVELPTKKNIKINSGKQDYFEFTINCSVINTRKSKKLTIINDSSSIAWPSRNICELVLRKLNK